MKNSLHHSIQSSDSSGWKQFSPSKTASAAPIRHTFWRQGTGRWKIPGRNYCSTEAKNRLPFHGREREIAGRRRRIKGYGWEATVWGFIYTIAEGILPERARARARLHFFTSSPLFAYGFYSSYLHLLLLPWVEGSIVWGSWETGRKRLVDADACLPACQAARTQKPRL